MAKAFAQVRLARDAPSPAANGLELADAWKLFSLWRPSPRPPDPIDIAVPDAIAGDSRLRMAFFAGALAARELGLNVRGSSTDELIALGRETIADHVLSGTVSEVLIAVARQEGKVDDAAWKARDTDKIAEQVDAFLQTEFRAEIELYQALEGLASAPSPPSREALADALLREQDIDPDAWLETAYPAIMHDLSASSPPLVRDQKAGEFYFQADKLSAAVIGRMKTRAGARPTPAHIARVLAALPASLDTEFGRRFDAHKQHMSALLAKWLALRLSMHARRASINLDGARVSIARATLQHFERVTTSIMGRGTLYRDVRGKMPSGGFLITVEGGHRCFIANGTGEIHALPPDVSVTSWMKRERELVFGKPAVYKPSEEGGAALLPYVEVQEMAAGPHDSIQEWLSGTFQAQIERDREALRGQTYAEGAIDTLLNLVPFRAMVVALRNGDIPTAIMMGGLDLLSLVPLIGAGVRLSGAAAKSAAPWLGMGLRLGGRLGGWSTGGLRHVVDRVPGLRSRVRATLTEFAIQGWGRLRPLDVARVAQALRASAPRLAGMLDGIVARARGATIPDGVWRVAGHPAVASRGEAITSVSRVTARNLQGGRLALLPYGERAGAYSQVDTAGRRVGALLVTDSGGWLHQTMPVASVERYRVASPTLLRALEGRLPSADGTVTLDGDHYARLGSAYVQVRRDLAASTPTRPIWRAAVPPGVTPDLVAHRLLHDPNEGLWRRVEPPGLAGGFRPAGARSAAVPATPLTEVRLTPDATQLARFRDTLTAGMRGATQAQVDAVRALLDRIAGNPRGKAILNAMIAHYELLGEAPDIVLREGVHATRPRPSVDHPMPGKTWYLDLGMLRVTGSEAAVQELAAVYNNMTGILQNMDPFGALVAQGGPPLDPQLEQAWAAWITHGAGGAVGAMGLQRRRAPGVIGRQATVSHLRVQLREARCYGGLNQAALKTLLRHADGRTTMKIDLSGRRLDSVPPLPADTRLLSLSNNPIRDWRNLPQGLTVLSAERVHMRALPPNLPASLHDLNVSNNLLRNRDMVLPPRLERLEIAHNRLASLPALPATVRELVVSDNALEALPAGMPVELRLLNVNGNVLTELPADLPAGLEVLLARGNRFAALPHPLPAGLREVDLSSNMLETLPALPAEPRVLDVRSNRLSALPEDLPGTLEVLIASRNRLRRLPARLPAQLEFLGLQFNAIDALPATITALTRCWIFLDGNLLGAGDIPVIPPGRAGPRFSLAPAPFADPAEQLTLSDAVRPWLARSSPDAQARWEAIEGVLHLRDKTVEFSQFLVRLRHTASHGDAGFRAQVEEWLVTLSRPERRALLVETLDMCGGATETCDDRIVTVWNDLQLLHRNDDIRLGLYDERVADAVDLARQMFRIKALTDAARRRERVLLEAAARPGGRQVDQLEVYLSHVVHLRDALRLTIVAPKMQFHDALAVPDAYLAEALDIVRARERDEFDPFLVLDYAPWQTLLKRKDAAAYAAAEAAADQAVRERFDEELEKAVASLALPADPALLDDARKDLGPRIMREIRYGVMAPLTRALLAREDVPAQPPPD
ncbi:NEL domain-containing protein [Bordetella sputigena]|uniref:NEL-type E3 ubiquitin ligase domain-containing protein n=1 Tax=Bordetella sputigena TaxID=1416810 RepID=UPI0039F0A53A